MNNTSMHILGLDPAFSNTGIVLAEYDLRRATIAIKELRLVHTESDKAGRKTVRKNSDDLRRATETLRALDLAIADHQPSFAFCEVPIGAQSARAAWSLGIAVGLIAHVGSLVPLIQLTPKEVKDVTGEVQPDKADMIRWASKMYPAANWPRKSNGSIIAGKAEHMADATAAIHAGVLTDEFRRTVSLLRVMRGTVSASAEMTA